MELSTAVVFSLCQPRLACEFSKVHGAMEFIAGQSVWTHSIPRVLGALKPSLMRQFPWAYSEDAVAANQAIADAADSGSRESVMTVINSEMNRLSQKFGTTHIAREIADPTSIYRNPLLEADELFPGKIVPVVISEEADDDE